MSEPAETGLVAEFTEDTRKQYLLLIASGKTSAAACRELCLSANTPYNYSNSHLSFRDDMTRAREIGTDALVDQLLELPDTEKDVNKARLKCENIRWTASKLNPSKYGDKIDISMRHSIDLDGAMADARERIAANQRKVIDITGESGPVVLNDDVVDIFS